MALAILIIALVALAWLGVSIFAKLAAVVLWVVWIGIIIAIIIAAGMAIIRWLNKRAQK